MTRRQKNKLIAHLLVWIGVISLYLAVIFPLARVMGLDLEALIVNLAQDYGPSEPPLWFADAQWIGWGKLLLAAGSAPLFLLTCTGLVYCLLPRRWRLESPFLGLPRWSRISVALASLVLFLWFCFPLSLGLVVWLQVEAYWWVQWYQNLDQLMEQIRLYAPPILLPGVVAGGIWAASFAVRCKRDAPLKRSIGRKTLRAAWLVVSVPTVLAALGPLAMGALHAGRVLAAPGPAVFEDKCGGCHDLALSLYYIKTPVEWERTVKTQEEEEGVDLSPEEREDVLGFLLGSRSFSDGWTFRTRCQRCHLSTRGWAKRRPEEWARVVDGLARWSPHYFRPDVKAQVLRYLGRTRAAAGARQGLDSKTHAAFQETARACSGCHSLSHGADRSRGQAPAELKRLVRRMNRKRAQPLSPARLSSLARTYQQLISDPARFERLFPHDRPAEDGWIKW